MCEPMTIAASMMAVGTAASMYGQYQSYEMASEQASAQDQMYERNEDRSYEALARQYGVIGRRQSQEQQKAVEDKMEVTREARAAAARARVSAGEAGVTGNSVKSILRDVGGSAARDRSTIQRNLDWTLQGLQERKRSAQSQAVNRINSVAKGQEPSSGALVAGLAQTGAEGYLNYQSMQPKNKSYGSNQSFFGRELDTGGY